MINYAWNWGVLIQDPYLGWLVSGVEMTLLISLSAWVLALAVGIVLGVVGALPGPARWILTGYVAAFRNVPLLLQLFIWFFVVPEMLPPSLGTWLKRDLPNPEFWTSTVALGLFTAARVGVQVRAGVMATGRGQLLAALACGMSLAQAFRFVLLPQALRLVLPPLTSEFLTVFKNSALALTIGVFELTAQCRQIENYTFNGFEAFTAATSVYLAIALLVTACMRQLERRLQFAGAKEV